MSVRRSLAWAFSGQFLAFAVGFAGSIAMARLLSPRELGIWAIAMAAQGIVAVFTQFGIGHYIVREAELRPGTLDTAFTVNAGLALLLSLILVGAAAASPWLLGDRAAGDVLYLSALAPLLGIVTFRANAMLQREMQFRTLTLIDSSTTVLNTAVSVACAALGYSYMSPAYGLLAGGIAGAAAYAVVGRAHLSFRPGLSEWRRITAFGLQIMSVSGVATLAARLSDVILGRLLGLAALGLYGRASNLSNLIFGNIYGTATRIVFVQLAREYRETGELRAGFTRGLALISGVMWPLLAGIAVLAGPLIHRLYGAQWVAAATPLAILMAAQILVIGFGMNWELFVLRGETARQARYEAARAVFSLAAFSIGALFSIAGAAVGRVVDAAVGLIVYRPHVRRLAGTGPGEIAAIYRASGLLTVVAVAPATAVMTLGGWASDIALGWLAGAVVAGVAAWLATVVAIGHPLNDELRLLWARVLRRQPAPPAAAR